MARRRRMTRPERPRWQRGAASTRAILIRERRRRTRLKTFRRQVLCLNRHCERPSSRRTREHKHNSDARARSARPRSARHFLSALNTDQIVFLFLQVRGRPSPCPTARPGLHPSRLRPSQSWRGGCGLFGRAISSEIRPPFPPPSPMPRPLMRLRHSARRPTDSHETFPNKTPPHPPTLRPRFSF